MHSLAKNLSRMLGIKGRTRRNYLRVRSCENIDYQIMQSIVIDPYSSPIIQIETPNEYQPVLLAFSTTARHSFEVRLLEALGSFYVLFSITFLCISCASLRLRCLSELSLCSIVGFFRFAPNSVRNLACA